MAWRLLRFLALVSLSMPIARASADPTIPTASFPTDDREAVPSTPPPAPAAPTPLDEKAAEPVTPVPQVEDDRASPTTGTPTIVARRDESFVDEPVPTYQPEVLDYRGYLALSDAAAIGLVIGGVALESGLLALGGLGTYLLGGPTIHATQGQGGRAGASVGLRLGIPVGGAFLGGLVGAAACPDSSPSDPETSDEDLGCLPAVGAGAAVGLLVGVVGAVVVDDVFLGRVELPKATGAPLHPRLTALGPLADPKRKLLGLTLGGTF